MGSGKLTLVERVARRLPERARLAFYRLGPITRWLRRALNRAAPKGVQPVQVAAGDLAGMWLMLDLQVDKDLWLGTYEPSVATAVRELTREGDVAFDLGANVGYTTFLFAKAVGAPGRVVAVEPLPSNVDRLRTAMTLNELGSRVNLVAAAVGEVETRATFRTHASGSMGRLQAEPGSAGDSVFEVDVVRVDDLVFRLGYPSPAIVKIDVEGGEAAALRGMSRVLRDVRPIVLLELHGVVAARDSLLELEAVGYRAWSLGGTPALVPTAEEAARRKNIVARPEGRP